MAESGQAGVWNGPVGDAWVRHADDFDDTLGPFGDAVLAQLDLQPAERAIDVGCGVGATTRSIAQRLPDGLAVGVDLSLPMLEEARRRAATAGIENIEFHECNIDRDKIPSAPFDAAFSRFGVMFFEDPLAAFGNIRRSLSRTGRLGFVCFQDLSKNPFIFIPILAAATHLDLPPPKPGEPSPFSLANAEETQALLESAGFVDVAIQPGPDQATLGGADDLPSLAVRLLEQNPSTARRIELVDSSARTAAIEATAAAIEPFVQGNVAVLGAGTWIVTASMVDATNVDFG